MRIRCLLKLGNKRTVVDCRVIVKDTKTLFGGSGVRGVVGLWGNVLNKKSINHQTSSINHHPSSMRFAHRARTRLGRSSGRRLGGRGIWGKELCTFLSLDFDYERCSRFLVRQLGKFWTHWMSRNLLARLDNYLLIFLWATWLLDCLASHWNRP